MSEPRRAPPTQPPTPPCGFSLSDPLVEAVEAAQCDHALFPLAPRAEGTAPAPPYPVIVGVSGGADSVCLLHVLATLAPVWHLELHVAHLDHALRPESAADAAWVAQLAQQLNLPFHTQRLVPGALQSHPGGVEDAARQARYIFLAETARKLATSDPAPISPTVAVAHHQDDQAETVLLHLIHGSGLTGLAGMSWVSEIPVPPVAPDSPPVRLVRPLLGISRAQILSALQRIGARWREDDTNQDPRYLRNRIRHELLPVLAEINPQIHATLARTAQIVEGDAARLARIDLAALANLTVQCAPNVPVETLRRLGTAQHLALDLERLRTLEEPARRGLLRQAVACFPIDQRRMGFAEFQTLTDAGAPISGPDATAGPFPLADKLAWSRLAATGSLPPRLSLHLTDCLPWQPVEPWLAENERTPPRVLPATGYLPVTPDWALHVNPITPEQLPEGWPASASPWEMWLDLDAPGLKAQQLWITTPQPGLRIAPLGMGGHTKSLGDLFTDAKIHPTLRPGWPILVASATAPVPSAPVRATVLWVCGFVTAHATRLSPATRRILHLRWEPVQSPPSSQPSSLTVVQ